MAVHRVNFNLITEDGDNIITKAIVGAAELIEEGKYLVRYVDGIIRTGVITKEDINSFFGVVNLKTLKHLIA